MSLHVYTTIAQSGERGAAALKRLWGLSQRERRDAIQIELNVVEQVVLRLLIRFESATTLDLIQEAMNENAMVTDD